MMKYDDPPIRLLSTFQACYPAQSPDIMLKAPGREMWIAARITGDGAFTLIAPDVSGRVTFDQRSARQKRTGQGRPLPRWSRYPAGVVVFMTGMQMDVPGFVAVLLGDEPQGPRYEHALGIALAALWYAYNGIPYDDAQVLEIVERTRRDYVDVG